MVDQQDDRSVEEDPVAERADTESEQQQSAFAAGFLSEPEKIPAPALLHIFRRPGHQVLDVQQVAQDVVAVVADKRVAVHEQR